jgi:hypothetical protein
VPPRETQFYPQGLLSRNLGLFPSLALLWGGRSFKRLCLLGHLVTAVVTLKRNVGPLTLPVFWFLTVVVWIWNVPQRLMCLSPDGATILEVCVNFRRWDVAGGRRTLWRGFHRLYLTPGSCPFLCFLSAKLKRSFCYMFLPPQGTFQSIFSCSSLGGQEIIDQSLWN